VFLNISVVVNATVSVVVFQIFSHCNYQWM